MVFALRECVQQKQSFLISIWLCASHSTESDAELKMSTLVWNVLSSTKILALLYGTKNVYPSTITNRPIFDDFYYFYWTIRIRVQ